MIVADRLIKKLPADSSEILSLTKKILNNKFARDIVVSSDMTTASITATINSQIPETETLERIDSIISIYRESSNPYRRTSIHKKIYYERCQE